MGLLDEIDGLGLPIGGLRGIPSIAPDATAVTPRKKSLRELLRSTPQEIPRTPEMTIGPRSRFADVQFPGTSSEIADWASTVRDRLITNPDVRYSGPTEPSVFDGMKTGKMSPEFLELVMDASTPLGIVGATEKATAEALSLLRKLKRGLPVAAEAEMPMQSALLHASPHRIESLRPSEMYTVPTVADLESFGRPRPRDFLYGFDTPGRESAEQLGRNAKVIMDEDLRVGPDSPVFRRAQGNRVLRSDDPANPSFVFPNAQRDLRITSEMNAGGVPMSGHPMRVSAAVPVGKNPMFDPLSEEIPVTAEAAKIDPTYYAKLVKAAKASGLVRGTSRQPESIIKEYTETGADNIQYLISQLPTRDQWESEKWYAGGNKMAKRWSGRYGYSVPQMAAAVATLSPKNEWNQNTEAAKRIVKAMSSWKDERLSPAMLDWVKNQDVMDLPKGQQALSQLGRKFADIEDPLAKGIFIRAYETVHGRPTVAERLPEGSSILGVLRNVDGSPTQFVWPSFDMMGNAVSVLQDGSHANISRRLGKGHKVRSFYNNILDPFSHSGDITGDTHATAGVHLLPIGQKDPLVSANFGTPDAGNLGLYGTYPLNADAFRMASEAGGRLLPNQTQSVAWTAAQRLLGNKSKENISAAKGVWQAYKKGHINLPQTQEAVMDIMRASQKR